MDHALKILFLGTGAANGTPGQNKSHRLESSLFIKKELNILIDVTRFFSQQSKNLDKIDAILITHGHKDACGGINQLRSWWKLEQQLQPIPVYAHKNTITVIRNSFRQLDHFEFHEIEDNQNFNLGKFKIKICEIPHSRDPRFPTFAYKIQNEKTIIYASDMANLTPKFEDFCKDADYLIIDGATWKRKIFTHLRVDQDLPKICKISVKKIILTQIGKSAPSHKIFAGEIAKICPRAIPAYDGMEIIIP